VRPSAAFTTGRRPFGKLRVALSNVEGRHDDTTAVTKMHKAHKAHKDRVKYRRLCPLVATSASADVVRSEGRTDRKPH